MDEGERFIKKIVEALADKGIRIDAIPIGASDDLLETIELQGKIIKCLPCVEKAFGKIAKMRGKRDPKALVGQLAIRVLFGCIANDLEIGRDDYSERLLATLVKFCELTGLDKDKDYIDNDDFWRFKDD